GLILELATLAALVVFVIRAAHRLKPHFDELHYQPQLLSTKRDREPIQERLLSWWAVRRVLRYSGRVNLWLAGGFGVVYALYTVPEPWWPAWMGRSVFVLVNNAGGIPAIATGLVVLAAVPAAFQYGLWDNSVQDRCRRLELLLLTELDSADYWQAAAAAGGERGQGYFFGGGVCLGGGGGRGPGQRVGVVGARWGRW